MAIDYLDLHGERKINVTTSLLKRKRVVVFSLHILKLHIIFNGKNKSSYWYLLNTFNKLDLHETKIKAFWNCYTNLKKAGNKLFSIFIELQYQSIYKQIELTKNTYFKQLIKLTSTVIKSDTRLDLVYRKLNLQISSKILLFCF